MNDQNENELETQVENELESQDNNELETLNENEKSGNPEPSIPDTGYTNKPATYSPTAAPTGSSKVLVGVVVALGLVIIGLIIFIIVKLTNKDDKPISSSAEPTKIETTISADPNVNDDVTGTENGASNEITTLPEEPKFNVTVELGQYKGIEVNYEVHEVTEEDIEGALTYLAETLTEKQAVSGRALRDGDIAVIDYVGTMNGEVFDGGSATGMELELGSDTFIDGFEDGLVGKNIGDSVSLDLTFPDPYPNNPDYAGKAVNFLVNINEAYEYVTPELTDELVAANSDYASIEDYRAAAKTELERQAVEYADSKVNNDIIQKVIDNATFGGQIDEQIAYEIQDCIDYYDSMYQSMYGVSGAVYFGYIWGVTEDEYLAIVEEETTLSVKYNALLDEIAKVENLTCNDEEFDKMFQETFIDNYGFASKEEVYQQVGEELTNETVRGYVLHDKAESIIMDSAIINNKPE